MSNYIYIVLKLVKLKKEDPKTLKTLAPFTIIRINLIPTIHFHQIITINIHQQITINVYFTTYHLLT